MMVVFKRAIIVASVGAMAWASLASAQQAPAPAPPPKVGVVQARAVKMAPKVVLPGTVVARNDSKLASEVEGRVAWVAEVGTVVKAGDIIARIDKSVAGMQLASDKANVARLSAQLNFDRSQAERMDRLFSQAAIAKATRDQASSTRQMDEGALAQAQASLRKSQYQFSHSEIRAPFPGRVVARLINTGEYAIAGKEILRLVDIGSIEVKAQSPIDSAHFLREGMQVTVEVAHRPILAAVRAIVPVGDELSRTIEIRVALKPGQAFVGDAAKVMVPSAAPRNVLAVPRDALVLREDNTYVFKVDAKNVAARVAVQTGSQDGAFVEVRGQLKPGERVIVRGAERLEAGQKVQPILAS
ncbi:MAG: efflux RND transporter periplasmic adaptor subunit [Alphaproteobacteria bacterium]|nr:efflux RND transporter periplasmic adaptor subunit [Alphaproteobacteria bacterium]